MSTCNLRPAVIIACVCAAIQFVGCGASGKSALPVALLSDSTPVLRATASTATGAPGLPLVPVAAAKRLWILQGPGIEAQAMATDPEGIKFFSNPTRVVLYPVVANVKAPAAWKTILWHKYASFAAFQAAIQNGKVPAGTKIVGYDDESWSYTPANEQRDPIGYTIRFARLAHAHGYKMIAMPAEDLMGALFPGQDKFTAFLNFGMAKAVAPYVDYYHMQSQDLQTVPAAYVAYTQAILDQVHGVNPAVICTGAVSTASHGTIATTAAAIDGAIRASRPMVSGYWLNIVGPTTATAALALTQLSGAVGTL